MYLPRSLPLCEPNVAVWAGESGKRYDFAITRTASMSIDEPAVYIFVRREGNVAIPLYVGQTTSLQRRFGAGADRCPDEWRRAMAAGMTHVHVRFDPCTARTRQLEARDLVAALQPALNDAAAHEPEDALAVRDLASPTKKGAGLFSLHSRNPQMMSVVPSEPSGPADARALRTRAAASRLDPARDETIDDPEVEFDEAVHASTSADPLLVDETNSRPVAEAVVEAEVPAGVVAPAAEEISELHQEAEPTLAEPSTIEITESGGAATPAPEPDHGEQRRVLASARHPVGSASQPGLLGRLLRLVLGRNSGAPAAVPAQEATMLGGQVAVHEVTGSKATVAEASHGAEAHEAGSGNAAEIDIPTAPATGAAVSLAIPAPSDEHPQPMHQVPVEVAEHREAEAVVDAASAAHDVTDRQPVVKPTEPRQPVALQEDAKRSFELDATAPVVLFAGDVSAATGADILFDAITTICSDNRTVQFVFAGEGSLRTGLADRAARAGLSARCQFLGHITSSQFERVLTACDFVVIPARVPQDEALAQMALAHGKPVLTTHQASLGCIAHGQNGLVTYDNPGSMVWGIRELLGPLYGNIRRQFSNAA